MNTKGALRKFCPLCTILKPNTLMPTPTLNLLLTLHLALTLTLTRMEYWD